jgi:hypothetical protein
VPVGAPAVAFVVVVFDSGGVDALLNDGFEAHPQINKSPGITSSNCSSNPVAVVVAIGGDGEAPWREVVFRLFLRASAAVETSIARCTAIWRPGYHKMYCSLSLHVKSKVRAAPDESM